MGPRLISQKYLFSASIKLCRLSFNCFYSLCISSNSNLTSGLITFGTSLDICNIYFPVLLNYVDPHLIVFIRSVFPVTKIQPLYKLHRDLAWYHCFIYYFLSLLNYVDSNLIAFYSLRISCSSNSASGLKHSLDITADLLFSASIKLRGLSFDYFLSSWYLALLNNSFVDKYSSDSRLTFYLPAYLFFFFS